MLIVDDEPSLRLLCRVNLELEGFMVEEAGTVGSARDRLEVGGVDVLLLDVHIGNEDGRDLLDELKAHHAPVRVAMLTGSVDATGPRFAAADRVIVKPFEPSELVAAVRELAGSASVDSATT